MYWYLKSWNAKSVVPKLPWSGRPLPYESDGKSGSAAPHYPEAMVQYIDTTDTHIITVRITRAKQWFVWEDDLYHHVGDA